MQIRSSRHWFLLIAGLSALLVKAQGQFTCNFSTRLDPAQINAAMATGNARDATRYLKVHAVIAAIPDDNGGQQMAASFQRVQDDLDLANTIFETSGVGIQLQMCDPIEVVEDQMLYWATTGDPSPFLPHQQAGYITVYYVGFGPSGLLGGAVSDRAFVATGAPPQVLAHEVGHLLGLQHTVTNIGELELVDGSNCTTTADGICDTPAEPYPIPASMLEFGSGTCTYIGTLTDANGDAYTPMLNNIMAVTQCAPDAFTVQQGQVMRYVVDSLKTHLLASITPVVIDPLPNVICANAPPIALSASPSPGTFSGPLVQGGMLVNIPAAGGEYFVTYVPDMPPEGLFEMVDQFHVPELWYTGNQLPLPTDSVRQTFKAGRNGSFTGVDVRLHNTIATTYRLRLYAGSGAALTLLHDTVAQSPSTDTVWVHFAVNDQLPCVADELYSFVVTAAAPFDAIAPIGGYLGFGNNNLGPFNLMFRTWVRTNMPCQQATHNYTLYAAPDRRITNLADAYCHDDAEIHPLLADQLNTTASSVHIDGVASNTLVPTALDLGPHVVEHIYTINGCTDTLVQVFTVEGPMAFTYPQIPAAICLDTDPQQLIADPPLGDFLVDGAPAELLDPQALGIGTHSITHIHTAQLDTVTFADQACCATGYAFNTFLRDDEVSWQAFSPQYTGELESIRIPLELFNVERSLIVELHTGVGLAGPVLSTQNITANTHDGLLLTGTGLQMSAGNTYTWSIRKVADGDETLAPMLGFTPGEHYPLPGAAPYWSDTVGTLRFEEFIIQRIACTDSTEMEIEVEVCSGIEQVFATNFRIGPNPFSSSLSITNAGASSYAVYAATGQRVQSGNLKERLTNIPTNALADGVYLVVLLAKDGGVLMHQRVIKGGDQ